MSFEIEPTHGTLPPTDPTGGRKIIDLTPLRLSPEQTQLIEKGRAAFLYGAFMDPMIEAGISHVADFSMKPEDVSVALEITATLFEMSGKAYESQPNHLTGQALSDHQANVLAGSIITVPEEFEMSEENRLNQLKLADDTLSALPPEIQAIIAELNYEAFFKPQTMASGEKTRDRGEREKLLASLGKVREAMPHLTLTNWAIADIVKGIAEFGALNNTKIRIVDTGSGPGGTLSAITARLADSEALPEDLAISGIETTQGFYDQLDEFVFGDEIIKKLGLGESPTAGFGSLPVSEFGYLTIAKTDTLSGMKRLHHQKPGNNEIVVITGNYSWHRLDSKRKQEIMEMLRDIPNVIFLIGDFAIHGNPAAKQYFCLGANGPLNVGNLDLEDQFQSAGYSMVDLESETPQSLDPRFRDRIIQDNNDPNSDGHLWTAYKGGLATQALGLKAA